MCALPDSGGAAASAKVTAGRLADAMHLAKVNGPWSS
jgi:hypothetical protein